MPREVDEHTSGYTLLAYWQIATFHAVGYLRGTEQRAAR
jgi:hypothetical protein